MTWLDVFRKRLDEVTKAVTDTVARVDILPKVPEAIVKATTDLQESAVILLDDARNFIGEAGAKAWDVLTDEEKARKEGIEKQISDILIKSTEIIFAPTLVDELVKIIPKIKVPEIKLPDVPTVQDVINALGEILRPITELLDELTRGMRILKTMWVPIYDPITKRTYTSFDEYLAVLPEYLHKVGEVAKQMEMFRDIIKIE